MLILSRFIGESIIIGYGSDRVKILVADIRRQKDGCLKVRLGFDGPTDIPIHRSEIYEKIYGLDPPVEDPLDDKEKEDDHEDEGVIEGLEGQLELFPLSDHLSDDSLGSKECS